MTPFALLSAFDVKSLARLSLNLFHYIRTQVPKSANPDRGNGSQLCFSLPYCKPTVSQRGLSEWISCTHKLLTSEPALELVKEWRKQRADKLVG